MPLTRQCLNCAADAAPNRARCERCLRVARQTRRAQSWRRRSLDLCVACGQPAREGKRTCQRCVDARRDLRARRAAAETATAEAAP